MKNVETIYAGALTPLWNWLPAFRAVAETEHLPTAAKTLHVTPSALSRSIRLLEAELGEALFERRGRRLSLSPAGARLLEAVRLAMRTVHDGVLDVRDEAVRGPLRIYAPAPFFGAFVLDALAEVVARHPDVEPAHVGLESSVAEALVRGQIDVALTDDPVDDERVEVTQVGELQHRVACAPGHALTRVASSELAHWIQQTPFVAPRAGLDGVTHDAWPRRLPRRVGLRVAQMYVGIDAVMSGRFVAILPEAVAARAGLVALPYPEGVTTPLYVVQRRSVTPTRLTPARVLAAAIEGGLAAVEPSTARSDEPT